MVFCMTPTYDELLKKTQSLTQSVRELEQQNDLLQLKIRVLELAKLKGVAVPIDDRQIALGIVPTESIERVPEPVEPPAPPLKLPASTTKGEPKLRARGTDKFAHIKVTQQTVIIPDEVSANPQDYEEIGEEEVFEIKVTEAEITRHRIVRKKFRLVADRTSPPVIAKAPARFSHDYVSISLAVYIAMGKYLEHGALARLEKQFARLGADIPRQTQSDCIKRIATWVEPLYQLLFDKTRSRPYLQIDETFIRYINAAKPGSGQGYFWAIQAPDYGMVYVWIANRRHENVDTLVKGFSGILQSDGYAAYANYAKAHSGVTLTACWSHVFRKFRDALKVEPVHAPKAMKLISKMYELEEQWNKQGLQPDQRKEMRAEQSMPLAKELKALLDTWAADLSIPKNELREAVKYTAGQWEALLECLRHGHTKLDTNLLESKFRATKIGQRNWMFIGHPDAGKKSAVLYTLLSTCRIHRINPSAYLTDVLNRLVPHEHFPPQSLLEELLPDNWAKTHPQHIIKERFAV